MAATRRPPRLLLVTGMSGAGKSTVLDALEDMGWDVVDNLPVDLLPGFVRGAGECRMVPAAIGMDVRSRGFDPQGLPELIRSFEGVDPEILYLDSAGYAAAYRDQDRIERENLKRVGLLARG